MQLFLSKVVTPHFTDFTLRIITIINRKIKILIYYFLTNKNGIELFFKIVDDNNGELLFSMYNE